MDVGIILDGRNPPGWRRPWPEVYGFALDVVTEAERLGVSSVWLSEHHRFDDGYLSQPLMLAAAVAARTSSIRIGTGVLVAPFHHPVHLAEQATLVDLLSGGRLDLGLGAGRRLREFELFGADYARRYDLTDELVVRLREQWADPAVLPAPVHGDIPVWLGYYGPRGARRAGRLGAGLLALEPAILEPYLAGLRDGGHDPASARMKGTLALYASDDPERDWPVVARHWAYKSDSYARHYAEGVGEPPPPVDPEAARAGGLAGQAGGIVCDTPEEIAAQVVAATKGLPVKEVIFWASFGGMPDELVLRHVQTIATKVRPLLAAV